MKFKDGLQKSIYYSSIIDYIYYTIQDISEHNYKNENIYSALIERDKSGFNLKNVFNEIKHVKQMTKRLIKSKTQLGCSTIKDEEFLIELNKLYLNYTKNINNKTTT